MTLPDGYVACAIRSQINRFDLHQDKQRLANLGVRVVVAGHAAYFATIKATYDSLRAQRKMTQSTSNLSATELTHTYTQPESYVAWAKEFMDVKE